MMNWMTQAYIFEKELCQKCKDHSLRRIVHAIESGTIPGPPGRPQNRVEYLIFEKADSDIRHHLDAQQGFDVVFALRTLHNVAAALRQLHSRFMAHQDLKPSNVLVFREQAVSKIADLGRAWSQDLAAPHDSLEIAGDPGYAPPELDYGAVPSDMKQRRFGCDFYHLGSLIVFFFTRVDLNALRTKYLAPEHRPNLWLGSFTDVMPYLQAAFSESLTEFRKDLPEYLRDDLTEIVSQLGNPDPERRGRPINRKYWGNQFALDWYVSRLNHLAWDAQGRLMLGTK
jgi:serine/threonine protein kinase